ncbi:unnamed protein product [Schistocephalus solidus]|uniref:Protein bark beetle n=1 Tax=Schistocephalus solidus TaxID=70667 RepID=A0A183SYE1_SCHSO|nr:unnamed protein product [Schistocephalus solidus]
MISAGKRYSTVSTVGRPVAYEPRPTEQPNEPTKSSDKMIISEINNQPASQVSVHTNGQYSSQGRNTTMLQTAEYDEDQENEHTSVNEKHHPDSDDNYSDQYLRTENNVSFDKEREILSDGGTNITSETADVVGSRKDLNTIVGISAIPEITTSGDPVNSKYAQSDSGTQISLTENLQDIRLSPMTFGYAPSTSDPSTRPASTYSTLTTIELQTDAESLTSEVKVTLRNTESSAAIGTDFNNRDILQQDVNKWLTVKSNEQTTNPVSVRHTGHLSSQAPDTKSQQMGDYYDDWYKETTSVNGYHNSFVNSNNSEPYVDKETTESVDTGTKEPTDCSTSQDAASPSAHRLSGINMTTYKIALSSTPQASVTELEEGTLSSLGERKENITEISTSVTKNTNTPTHTLAFSMEPGIQGLELLTDATESYEERGITAERTDSFGNKNTIINVNITSRLAEDTSLLDPIPSESTQIDTEIPITESLQDIQTSLMQTSNGPSMSTLGTEPSLANSIMNTLLLQIDAEMLTLEARADSLGTNKSTSVENTSKNTECVEQTFSEFHPSRIRISGSSHRPDITNTENTPPNVNGASEDDIGESTADTNEFSKDTEEQITKTPITNEYESVNTMISMSADRKSIDVEDVASSEWPVGPKFKSSSYAGVNSGSSTDDENHRRLIDTNGTDNSGTLPLSDTTIEHNISDHFPGVNEEATISTTGSSHKASSTNVSTVANELREILSLESNGNGTIQITTPTTEIHQLKKSGDHLTTCGGSQEELVSQKPTDLSTNKIMPRRETSIKAAVETTEAETTWQDFTPMASNARLHHTKSYNERPRDHTSDITQSSEQTNSQPTDLSQVKDDLNKPTAWMEFSESIPNKLWKGRESLNLGNRKKLPTDANGDSATESVELRYLRGRHRFARCKLSCF